MKKYIVLIIAFCSIISLRAEQKTPVLKDTLFTELKNDIVILSSIKETNSLRALPASVSIFSPKNLDALQVHSLKDLSAIVPNYFVADYGSKMTAPIYIRGVGARSGYQTVSMYVDNIPYFNTTTFDTELVDIQRVEVLRGTQGALYGRNAMGGIMNIYTYSPLSYEGTIVKIGGGNYGYFSANASHYRRLNKTMGISVGAYYNRNDGYFRNQYTGKLVDDLQNVGARLKFVWKLNPNLTATYSTNFDFVDQGAFPYKNVETDEISYNSEGLYRRKTLTNGLSLKYEGQGYEINSITGYQYLNDEMNMDQDYTPLSMFQINQRQKQNSLSQEITIKSSSLSDYQWSGGVMGFYDYLHTTPPVYMMEDGVQNILQNQMTVVGAPINFSDTLINLGGNYKRPSYGAAIFHQSTFNNILTKGLSATFGLRLDYEKTKLDYDASSLANFNVRYMPTMNFEAKPVLKGKASDDFLELLPKAVVKYQFNSDSYIYTSASRGYKTGGHNIQIFADLLQEALTLSMFDQMPPAILPMLPQKVQDMLANLKSLPTTNDRISYKPEYSWNYELGGRINLLDDAISTNVALYYMDVSDIQLTQFVQSGGGRIVTNGGKAISKGFEMDLKVRPCKGFYLYGSYGFSDAKFREYITDGVGDNGSKVAVDYSDNYIPFAPRSTFSIGGSISYDLKRNTLLDRIVINPYYAGVGKIYWDESNATSQGFYGTLNIQLALEKNIFTLEFWGKNVLDRKYNTFLFESMGNHFAQQGKPARWGASLKIRL